MSEIDLQEMRSTSFTSSEGDINTHEPPDAFPLMSPNSQKLHAESSINYQGMERSSSSFEPLHRRVDRRNIERNTEGATPSSHLVFHGPMHEPVETPLEGDTTKDDGLKQKALRSWLSGFRVKSSPYALFVNRFRMEPVKEVCSDKKRSALQQFAIFHLPAISVTLILLSLYTVQIQWDEPTSEELSALQFAAKGHEALILMSLADILLHRIRYGLLCAEGYGIPLGFLSSAFYLPSPLRYLFSWEFWGTAFSPAGSRSFHVTTSILILLLVFISLGAGPFSAIVMIPRLGWQEFHSNVNSDSHWYVDQDTYGIAYPMELQASTKAIERNCRRASMGSCKSQNLSLTFENIRPLSGIYPALIGAQNISTTSYGVVSPNRPITLSLVEPGTTVATGPMAFLSDPLSSSIAPFDQNQNILVQSKPSDASKLEKWRVPLVAVDCQCDFRFPPSHTQTLTYEFLDSYHGAFDVKVDSRRALDSFNNTRLGGGPGYSYLDPISLNLEDQIPVPISAAMLFINNDMSCLCLIQARWKDADVWINAEGQPAVKIDLGVAIVDIPSYLQDTSNSQNVIGMPHEALKRLGAMQDARNITESSSAYREIWNFCLEPLFAAPNLCFSSCLATYFADHLTFSSYWAIQYSAREDFYPSNPKSVNIAHKYYAYVYSYNFQSSFSIILAFTVLLLHTTVAIVHIAIILLSKTPWHSSGWKDFGQLIALALRSQTPRDLQNIGGGVQSSETWKEVLYIRDVMDMGRLEMVLGVIPEGVAEEFGRDSTYCAPRHVKAGVKYA